jgi:uncharacterized protein YkwD
MFRTLQCLALALFLVGTAAAQTVRIQGKELPYRLMDGKQMISREILAKAFPGFPEGEGSVDLAVLIDDPNARVLRRNGLIVSVRYYDKSMAALYGDSRPKARTQPGETPSETPTGGGYREIMDEIVRLSNIEREKHGALPLEADPLLETSATGHSEEMAKLNYFSHTSPTPGRETPHDRIRLAGSAAQGTGENIAVFTGHSEDSLAKKSVVGWMNSPPHRKNLLDPSFTHIGIGVGKTGKTYYLTQNFATY